MTKHLPKNERIYRGSKIVTVASMAALFSVVVFGNLTDYATNLGFVRHVLTMDTTLPDAAIRYRAVTHPVFHHLAYGIIIAAEVVAAGFCWAGCYMMLWTRRNSPAEFTRAKATAVTGLTVGYVLWQVGLFVIGNEWFGMWMSREWNGVDSAFRFLVMTLGALIYVALPEPPAHYGAPQIRMMGSKRFGVYWSRE